MHDKIRARDSIPPVKLFDTDVRQEVQSYQLLMEKSTPIFASRHHDRVENQESRHSLRRP